MWQFEDNDTERRCNSFSDALLQRNATLAIDQGASTYVDVVVDNALRETITSLVARCTTQFQNRTVYDNNCIPGLLNLVKD